MSRIVSFLIRRAIAGVFTVWVMFTFAFVVFWSIPSQPANFVYPGRQHLTDYQIQQADHILGIDRPKLTQYYDYVWHVLHWKFGRSWGDYAFNPGLPSGIHYPDVSSELSREIGVTLSITLGGALFVLLLSVPLGAIAGSHLRSLSDRTISLVALIGVCTHPMVIALILRGIFGEHLHWVPPTGYCPLRQSGYPGCDGVRDWASHLILPWTTFTLLFLALYIRMIRASVAETLPEDFVRTARSKGASELRVMARHVLPNASLRVLTMVGMEIGTAIAVCAYIETAFGMQGLGLAGIQAMLGLDLPEILGVVTAITLIVVLGNLIVDGLYAFIDPRVRFTVDNNRTKSLAGGVI
ncbi:MAG TPA: ABC transporter permease [Gaiellaceae bacterium]|jgi:peptide/nickel transport system permease protein